MKFKVRDGFVVNLATKVDLGNGTSEIQTSAVYAGQTVDLDAAVADGHMHKLEPVDKAAAAYLESRVLPVTAAAAIGITPEVQALAAALAREIVAQLAPPPAKAAAPAAA